MSDFIRLCVTAEGPTEERFVKDLLASHLGYFNISTDVRSVQTSKDKFKTYRGGLYTYQKTKSDIKRWLKENRGDDVRFTTMFDFYGLPNDFPGYDEALQINDVYEKVQFIESHFMEDIEDRRFFPYIQLHEFESLILANPDSIREEYFDNDNAIDELKDTLKQHNYNPEKINDGDSTAPSNFC